VFRDYDFALNPLGFHARTLRSLQDSLPRIEALRLADSLGIDFHKTGYAPYISSVFLVKDRQHLELLSRSLADMPYLYQFGNYHPGIYSMECSRSGACALAALANMQLLGKQGYRVLSGHAVEMSEMLRERLEGKGCIRILNDHNYGPVTLFRVYPEGMDAHDTWLREVGEGEAATIETVNAFNHRLFEHLRRQALQGKGVLLSWTDDYQMQPHRRGPAIAAIKSFIMSPWTDLASVDAVVEQVLAARAG
jgi:glutamate/tyrosine decarboxylase-like PLP-dependent enzyme